MTVKLAILRSGENIISDIKEGFYQDKLVCYILENPCKVTINGSYKILDQENNENQYSISLTRWPILSKDTTIEIIPDYIVTLVEPVDNAKKLYETQVLGIEEDETNQSIAIDEQSDSDQSD
jgi:hypothetical protein